MKKARRSDWRCTANLVREAASNPHGADENDSFMDAYFPQWK